jgi:hypothetical protein
MLGSAHDGEILAAARKAQAILVTQDWTWPQLLTNGSGGTALTQEQIAKVYAAGLQKGEALGYQRGMADSQVAMPQARAPTITIDDDIAWIGKVLEAAEQAEADDYLDVFETDFSGSMRAKISRFGRATYVSQKQFDALRRLEQSLRRRGYL